MHAATSPSRRPFLVPGLPYRPGDRLAGKYRLVSLVRRGHACAHLAAIELSRNANVSIQLFLPPARAAAKDVESARFRFLNAATRSTALRSPHVAQTIDAGLSSENLPFIVREELPPKTLADLLVHGSMRTHVAVAIALDVCAALVEAHARGVLHGELSPSSVHIVEDPVRPSAMLSDLGSAHALSALPESTERRDAVLAPELAGKGASALEARADIWGVGVLLYTMLAGSPPDAEDPESLAGVPDGLADVIDACLAKDPSKRPRMVSTLAAALAPFAAKPMPPPLESISITRGLAEMAASTPQLDAAPSGRSLIDPDATAPQDAAVRDELLTLLSQTSAFTATKLPETIRSIRTGKPVAQPPVIPQQPISVPPPPVVRTIAPTLAPPPSRWQAPVFAVAGLAAAFALLAVSPRILSTLRPPTAAAAAAPAPAPQPETEPTTAVATTPRPTEAPPPATTSTSTAVNALPAAAATHAPTRAAEPTREKHPKARTSAAATEIPVAREEAKAEPKPEPAREEPKPKKADDDDLRRYLDDRR